MNVCVDVSYVGLHLYLMSHPSLDCCRSFGLAPLFCPWVWTCLDILAKKCSFLTHPKSLFCYFLSILNSMYWTWMSTPISFSLWLMLITFSTILIVSSSTLKDEAEAWSSTSLFSFEELELKRSTCFFPFTFLHSSHVRVMPLLHGAAFVDPTFMTFWMSLLANDKP